MSPRTAIQNEQIREQRRQAILAAALTVFGQRGFAASTIDLIAKEAGASKGLVYNYFSSKEDLLHSIFQNLMAQSGQIIQPKPEDSAVVKLRRMLDATFVYIQQHKEITKLTMQLALQEDVVLQLQAFLSQAVASKMEMLENIFEEMGLENPKIETYTLGALLDGISFGYLTLGDDYPLEAMKARLYIQYQLL